MCNAAKREKDSLDEGSVGMVAKIRRCLPIPMQRKQAP